MNARDTRSIDRDSRRAPLDRALIVQVARGIVDTDGLDALTMRRLGRELGVEAMSIYHHVEKKSVLLDLLAAEIVDSLQPPPNDVGAADTVALLTRSLRELLVARSNAVELVRPDAAIGSAAAADAIARLEASGFDRDAARWLVEAFVGYAIGHTSVAIATGCLDDDAAFETGLRLMLVGLRLDLGDEP